MTPMKCAKTGKEYIHNIPVGELFAVTAVNGDAYRIMACCRSHVEDCWYDGRFIGDDYCVCVKHKNSAYWFQLGHWYHTFKGAQKFMLKKASENSQGILEEVLR